MGEQNVPGVPAATGQPRTSGMAIAAFVCSLVPACGVTQIVGLILGIVSLVKIGRSGGMLKGKGLGIAAVVIAPILLIFSLFLALPAAGLFLPAVSRARGEARRAACMNNLHQLGFALMVYQNDHGEFPSTGRPGDSAGSLALLYPDYVPDLRLFRCPADRGRAGLELGALTEETCSYHYDNTVPPNASYDRMLAWDKSPDYHYGARCVLFADGHIESLSEEEFQSRLAEQGGRLFAP